METAMITFKVRINKDKLDVEMSDFINEFISTVETPIEDEEGKVFNAYEKKGFEIMCENFTINP